MLLDILGSLNQKRIVLASASPRRRDILTGLGLRYEVIPSTFEENLDKNGVAPSDYVVQTAAHKGLDVGKKLLQESGPASFDYIISADTVVVRNSHIMEKPRDETHAKEMLRALSESQNDVYSGVCIICLRDGKPEVVTKFFEKTTVLFAALSEDLIEAYVRTGEPMDKAGGYGIQGIAAQFVSGIEGCYYNVVGFPLHRFCVEFRKLVDIA